MPCTTIGFYDVCVDIIIPVISAILGGFLTMWGVLFTIKRERENAKEQTRLAAKPWLFSLDDSEYFDSSDVHGIVVAAKEKHESHKELTIVIRNTDNGVGIVKKLQTENNTYLPISGRIIDKSSINYLQIVIAPNETLKDMYLFITDIYNNVYKYKVEQVTHERNLRITEQHDK